MVMLSPWTGKGDRTGLSWAGMGDTKGVGSEHWVIAGAQQLKPLLLLLLLLVV
jgi:hypothetical protein